MKSKKKLFISLFILIFLLIGIGFIYQYDFVTRAGVSEWNVYYFGFPVGNWFNSWLINSTIFGSLLFVVLFYYFKMELNLK